jgi:hypothetical protein
MLLALTHKCFESCPHCMVCATPDSEEHATEETVNNYLHLVAQSGSRVCQISGGEFTLHPQWFELCTRVILGTSNPVVLESNGWWHDKPEYVANIKTLTSMRDNVLLQVRTDKQYYSNYEQIIHSKVLPKLGQVYDGDIYLGPYGRARDNYTEFSEKKSHPSCSNVFLLVWQGAVTDFPSLVQMLHSRSFFCKPKVSPSGDVLVGESSHCVSIGNVSDSMDTLFQNLKNTMPCNGCGLKSKLDPYMARFGR